MTDERILVVEDEAVVAMDLEDRLLAMGYQLAGQASTGEQALELCARERPDLILMDIRLAGDMDGVQAAMEIRQRLRLPVIFLTAYSEEATLARAKLAEPYGYLLKPLEDRELRSAVEIALYKHQAEQEIMRLNRLYDVLSQINQMVVRANSREELLPSACRFVVERGQMDLAWIGWLEETSRRLEPVAWHGRGGEMLEQQRFFVDDSPQGQGTPGQAFRLGQPVVCNECLPGNCCYPPDQAPARFGFLSCGSFPLSFQGKVCGALNVCVAEKGYFGPREVALLKEVAGDISFALDKLAGDAQRERLALEVARHSQFLQSLIEAMPYPVFYKDAQLRYLGCNRAYESFLGTGRERIFGKTVHQVWPPDRAEAYDENDRRLLADPAQPVQVYEDLMRDAQGRERHVIFHRAVFKDPGGGVGGIIGAMEDVTERKLGEQALRESERRFRQVVETAPDGIFIQTRGLFAYLNSAALAIFGAREPGEMLGRPVLESFHPDDRPGVRERIRKLNHDRESVPLMEEKILRLDGGLAFIEVAAAPFQHQGEEGALVFLRDVSARKRAEEEVRESQRKLTTLMANLPGMAYRCRNEQDWTMEFVSEGCLALTGYQPAEMVDSRKVSYAQIIHAADRDAVWAQVQHALERREPFRMLYRIVTAQGRDKWVWEQGCGVYGPDGGLLALEGFIADIDDRKRAESALHENQKRLQAILAASPDPVAVYDPRWLVSYVNPAFTRVFGWQPAEILGESPRLTPEELQSTMDDKLKELTAEGRTVSFETEGLTREGRVLDIMVSAAGIYDERGRRTGTVVTYTDLTDTKRLEAQLRQAQKMEALGTLAGGIAHDFNNILGAIIGYGELAREMAAEGEQIHQEMDQVLAAAERAKALVRQILTFSRKAETDSRPMDLNQSVRQTMQMLGHTLPKMIDIQIDLDDQLPAINGDPAQMEQMIMNLAVNAADAMPGGGHLRISTRFEKVLNQMCPTCGEVFSGGYVALEVADSGQGMDPDTMERIFDPFFTTKEAGRGTGLGLSTVYGIVLSHGGHIRCVSQPEQGAVFTVHLPVQSLEQADQNVSSSGSREMPRGHETILVAEDEEALRRLTCGLLENLGYATRSAASGEEALEIYQRSGGQVDLVVMDLSMPGMGGQKCLQQIKALDPQAKVIIISGYMGDGQAKEAMQAGALGYLAKPFRREELAQIVRQTLDG